MNKQQHNREYYRRTRMQVLQKINPSLRCERCNCNIIDFLEINHKEGGGAREYRDLPNNKCLHYSILKDQRDTDDLELLCRPCNAIHYLELKYKRPLPMQVVWTGGNEEK